MQYYAQILEGPAVYLSFIKLGLIPDLSPDDKYSHNTVARYRVSHSGCEISRLSQCAKANTQIVEQCLRAGRKLDDAILKDSDTSGEVDKLDPFIPVSTRNIFPCLRATSRLVRRNWVNMKTSALSLTSRTD